MTPHDAPETTYDARDHSRADARTGVAARLKARRRRVRVIRKRALAVAASTFALVWGVIFVQLVSGHDPALGHSSSGTAASTTGSSGSSSSTSSPSSSGSTSSSGSNSSAGTGSSSSGATSPITTSQS